MLLNKSKFCCEGISTSFMDRKDRGVFVFCEPDNYLLSCGPTFWIGMRSVRFEDIDRFAEERRLLPERQNEKPFPVTISTWLPIKYCPWCGKNLKRFYKRSFEVLVDEDLSKEHGWNAEPQN